MVLYDYYSAKILAQHFEAPLARVTAAISADDYALAFELSFTLAELAAEYAIEVDDSGGYMGGVYFEAKELMDEATPADLPETVRERAFAQISSGPSSLASPRPPPRPSAWRKF